MTRCVPITTYANIVLESSTNSSIPQSEVTTGTAFINRNSTITGCKDRPLICGKEAACRSFDDNTSKCVCPHDSSPPTVDLKCPNRLIGQSRYAEIFSVSHCKQKLDFVTYLLHNVWSFVSLSLIKIYSNINHFVPLIILYLSVPLTPRPIPNIIPPNGNSTNSTTTLQEVELVITRHCCAHNLMLT